ncbi:MAG: toll/interleukin-1 receptor domain-containing protein [Chloroflexi bacterium]|nr:toll/interleukin-1 receptor domain-containing protein [Chloroflexota bacterium]
MNKSHDLEFDVLLSFAGPERDYARAIHDIAAANGLHVFLDEEFQHEIWGKNLVEYLDSTYRERGGYVLVLISAAYRERAFTRVERRAAFDRMIREASEYLLPVKVDDSWIDGLPTSTAYLDLRVHGVLGVCEVLVRKIRGSTGKLIVPPAVSVPRVPLGRLPGDQLATYLLELCARPQVTAFGALIYDESGASLRKLLRDRDYWDALDKASGPHFEVFAIRDVESHEIEPFTGFEMLTAASLSRSRSRGYYFSRLLKEYFGEDKTRLAYPSFLLFLAERGRVRYCRLIPFQRTSIEDTFERLSALFSGIASGIEEVGGPMVASDVLWEHLKTKLLNLEYTLYIQNPPTDAGEAVRQLTAYVEK